MLHAQLYCYVFYFLFYFRKWKRQTCIILKCICGEGRIKLLFLFLLDCAISGQSKDQTDTKSSRDSAIEVEVGVLVGNASTTLSIECGDLADNIAQSNA